MLRIVRVGVFFVCFFGEFFGGVGIGWMDVVYKSLDGLLRGSWFCRLLI